MPRVVSSANTGFEGEIFTNLMDLLDVSPEDVGWSRSQLHDATKYFFQTWFRNKETPGFPPWTRGQNWLHFSGLKPTDIDPSLIERMLPGGSFDDTTKEQIRHTIDVMFDGNETNPRGKAGLDSWYAKFQRPEHINPNSTSPAWGGPALAA